MTESQTEQQQFDRRRIKGIESRNLILLCAIRSIAALGLSNTTLDRVAEMANVSRGLVVFHFKSKNQLFKEVLQFLGQQYSQGWNSACQTHSDSPMQRILALVEYDIQFANDNPKFLSTWHAFWGESKGNMLYHQWALPGDERYLRELKLLLKAFIEENDYALDQLDDIANGLGAMLFGMWLKFHLDPQPDQYTSALSAVRLFLSQAFPTHPLPV